MFKKLYNWWVAKVKAGERPKSKYGRPTKGEQPSVSARLQAATLIVFTCLLALIVGITFVITIAKLLGLILIPIAALCVAIYMVYNFL